jgi:hypothetical protein
MSYRLYVIGVLVMNSVMNYKKFSVVLEGKSLVIRELHRMAEGVGFEPTDRLLEEPIF